MEGNNYGKVKKNLGMIFGVLGILLIIFTKLYLTDVAPTEYVGPSYYELGAPLNMFKGDVWKMVDGDITCYIFPELAVYCK